MPHSYGARFSGEVLLGAIVHDTHSAVVAKPIPSSIMRPIGKYATRVTVTLLFPRPQPRNEIAFHQNYDELRLSEATVNGELATAQGQFERASPIASGWSSCT